MKKYFFFDIDGTLLAWLSEAENYIPDSTLKALKQLKDKGHFVAIATGRSRAMAKKTADLFGIDSLVSDGGNGVTINGKTIEVKPLDKDLCIELVKECNKNNIPWGIQPNNDTVRLIPDDSFLKATNDKYMESRIVEGLNPLDYENIFKMYVAVREKDQDKLPALNKLPWARYHDSYIFVEPIDKVVGIYRTMELLDAPIEDVVVFGDDLNDLTMFKDEWISIAMGNAKTELKKKATFITDSVYNDGIYVACKYYGWI